MIIRYAFTQDETKTTITIFYICQSGITIYSDFVLYKTFFARLFPNYATTVYKSNALVVTTV